MDNEWITARDGTEARRGKDGKLDVIEIRMTGRVDSTVHKLTKDNEPGFKQTYPALFKAPPPAPEPKPVVAPKTGKKGK